MLLRKWFGDCLSLQNLGQRLANNAERIQQLLQESGVPGHGTGSEAACTDASSSRPGWTIIHGDFKTANLFFSPTAGALTQTGL